MMKTEIYVFSGTGTSLAVAKSIAEVIGGDTQLYSIAKYRDQSKILSEAESIGFIFPCYFGGMPQIVEAFVSRLDMSHAKYIFSIITAGGHTGYGLKFLDEQLRKKGKALHYGNSVIIASNYMVGWYYTMLNPQKDKVNKIVTASEEKIAQYAKDIKEKRDFRTKGGWLGYTMPHIISPSKIIKDTRPWDIEFSASEKCSGCDVCSKVCPVGNITMTDKKPVFTHNCQRCMACIQYCPQQAIQFKGKDMNKPRYYHPEITVNEISEFHKQDS